MRTETNQVEMIVIRFPVNQDQIRLDVTVSVVGPITRERMIKITMRQRNVNGENVHNFHEDGIQIYPCLPDFSRL
jgi:hypothetical protein